MFGGRSFDTRGCFLLWLPSNRLSGSVDLGFDFLGQAFFLVAVTLCCVGASVTGWEEGI